MQSQRQPVYRQAARFKGGPLDGRELPIAYIGGGPPLVLALRPDSDPQSWCSPSMCLTVRVPGAGGASPPG
jgi:hypothetical protein